jgi:hypothetical protein
MTSPFTARQAGLASIVAAALMVVSQVSQLVLPLTMPESFWIATQSVRMGLAFLAMFALLLALTGLYSRQVPVAGGLGLVGYLVAFLGTMLVAGDWWYEAFIGPALREQAPEVLTTAPSASIIIGAAITSVTFAAGWAIFGLATVRAGVWPQRMAVLMTVGGVAGVLTLIAPFQLPLAFAVGWMGWWLVGADARLNVAAQAQAYDTPT